MLFRSSLSKRKCVRLAQALLSWSGELRSGLHDARVGEVESTLLPQFQQWRLSTLRHLADFEALVQPKEGGPTRGDKTYLDEHHRPCTVGYKIKSYFPTLDEPYPVIHGPDCLKKFIRRMSKFEKKAVDYYNDDKRFIMSHQDTMEFNRSMKCRFCHGPFEFYPRENGEDIKYKDKVRDHDHLPGRFLGAAHSSCNLRHHKTLKIPIFFHNFHGYDAHITASHLENIDDDHHISVIGPEM